MVKSKSEENSTEQNDDKLIRDFKSKQNNPTVPESREHLSDKFIHEHQLTDRECPYCDDSSRLWSNSYELVCESCAVVLGQEHAIVQRRRRQQPLTAGADIKYSNSGRVVLPGGFFEAYSGDGIYGKDE